MPATNATSRFSDRVENYVRYRPGYPDEALTALREECGLTPEHAVADIASGTGIWTRMLLENGNRVFGVEPNAGMRDAGEQLLAPIPKIHQHCRIGGDDQPTNRQRGFCNGRSGWPLVRPSACATGVPSHIEG